MASQTCAETRSPTTHFTVRFNVEFIAAHTIDCCPLTAVLEPKRSVSVKDAKQDHQAEEPNVLHNCIEFSGNFGGVGTDFQPAGGSLDEKLFHTVVEQAGWL